MYIDKIKCQTILKRNVAAQFQNIFQCEKKNCSIYFKICREKKNKTIWDEITIFKMDLCKFMLETYKANKMF